MSQSNSIKKAAMHADMCKNTARKYLNAGKLPSEVTTPHLWRTRTDPFEESWPEIVEKLKLFPGLESKTLFEWICKQYPTMYSEGQLRTLQRRIKQWRAEYGEEKEVFFEQIHYPGDIGESDFTSMDTVGVTIGGVPYSGIFGNSGWIGGDSNLKCQERIYFRSPGPTGPTPNSS